MQKAAVSPDRFFGSVKRYRCLCSLFVFGLQLLATVLWWISGWRSPQEYGTSLLIAGLVAVLLGLFSLIGGWSSVRS